MLLFCVSCWASCCDCCMACCICCWKSRSLLSLFRRERELWSGRCLVGDFPWLDRWRERLLDGLLEDDTALEFLWRLALGDRDRCLRLDRFVGVQDRRCCCFLSVDSSSLFLVLTSEISLRTAFISCKIRATSWASMLVVFVAAVCSPCRFFGGILVGGDVIGRFFGLVRSDWLICLERPLRMFSSGRGCRGDRERDRRVDSSWRREVVGFLLTVVFSPRVSSKSLMSWGMSSSSSRISRSSSFIPSLLLSLSVDISPSSRLWVS